jgi:hypothetical protein
VCGKWFQALYRGSIGEIPQQVPQHSPQEEHEVHSLENGNPDVVIADYLINQYGTEPIDFELDVDEPQESSFREKEAATHLYKGCKTSRLAFILI